MRNLTKRVVVSSHAFSVLWPAGALPPLLEYPPTALWELSRKWDERKVGSHEGAEGGLCLVATIGKERKTVRGNGFMQVPHTHSTHPSSPFNTFHSKNCVIDGEISRGPRDWRIDGDDTSFFFLFFPFSIDFLVVPIVRTLKRDVGSIHRSNGIYPSIRYISYERTCVRTLVGGKLSLRQIDSSRRDS